MYIGVIDGQGGGVGRALVAELKARLPQHRIVALGTNGMATSAMIRAGAQEAATGENAIAVTVQRCDVITGPIGIVLANAMLGELTPHMAQSIGSSAALKVLLPMPQSRVRIAGYVEQPLSQLVARAVEQICQYVTESAGC